MRQFPRYAVGLAFASVLCTSAWAQTRTELQRGPLGNHPDVEVVLSMFEVQPGQSVPRHFHHGVESAYVVQGSSVRGADGSTMDIKTGQHLMFPSEVPHAGFTVTGDTALKLFTVHTVEKGKPLLEVVK